MNREQRLKNYLHLIAKTRPGGLDAIPPATAQDGMKASGERRPGQAPSGLESLDEAPSPAAMAAVDSANRGLEQVKRDPEAPLAPEQMFGLEAIILPRERPVADVVQGDFRIVHPLWMDLNADGDAAIHGRLKAAIPAIGRLDLPGQNQIPYGGTAFIVGPGLMMTNRHVAQIFADGLGPGPIVFRPGWRASVDFLHENGRSESDVLRVKSVRMIHPYWDMALLEVEGPAANRGSLSLSLKDAGALDNHRVAVIGYPAFDPQRNDAAVQNQLFSGVYAVKRLQPGALHGRHDIESFGKVVPAGAHDCSTLGGNSGSAVIDLDTGDVLGLHFGGRYLDINYCVPSAELARDGRVVDAGVAFSGSAPGGDPPWLDWWRQTEAPDRQSASSPVSSSPSAAAPAAMARPAPSPAVSTADGGVTLTVPLIVTVRLGQPSPTPGAVAVEAAQPVEERLVEVWHDTDYRDRNGYSESFLAGETIALPAATDSSVVARLLDGGSTLKYRHFSIQMHAERRIALFTASNVTAEKKLKTPEPNRKYDRKTLSGLGDTDQEKWFPDPRLAPQFQLSDKFYTNDKGAFDKGHIVRREDVAWGATFDELRQGNGDTYHITNCSPQVAQFNRSAAGKDNWGDLENLALADAASERLCLFAGPVLDPDDEIFVGADSASRTRLRLRIPKAFWKVVVAKVADGVAAYAFVLDQDLSNVPLEFTVPENFRVRMIPVAELERRIGLRFPDVVRSADQYEDRGVEVAFRGGIQRAESLTDADAGKTTPNSGDDSEAATEAGVPAYAPPALESLGAWRTAESLKTLLTQINAAAPRRNKASDGTIGDDRHRTRASDHNAWVTEGGMGVVTALDVTNDPAGGCDAGALAAALRDSGDSRIKYIIWNRRICNREPIGGAKAWAWRPYGGQNPHNHHVHISVRPEKTFYDSKASWSIGPLRQ